MVLETEKRKSGSIHNIASLEFAPVFAEIYNSANTISGKTMGNGALQD